MREDGLLKYPRTHHVEGSRFQNGDEDLCALPFASLAGRHLVVEEKMDGANTGISFGRDGKLRLQSRGHYLTGGPRERHFDLFKRWAGTHAATLRGILMDRYVMYGEWLYAKHTVFYDNLDHYFLEFDICDRVTGEFLSTARRHKLLAGSPVLSVPVLHEGPLESLESLVSLLGNSAFISSAHREVLANKATALGLDSKLALGETGPTRIMEGLYIKVEEADIVTERYKFIRGDFLAVVIAAQSHWLDRPIIPNGLRAGVDLFAAKPGGAQ